MIRRTPTLSQAIRRGSDTLPGRLERRYIDLDLEASCPLGAAFLGSLPHGAADVQRFFTLARNSSDESIAEFILVGLHKAFPWIGQSIRGNARLEGHAEREGLVRRLPQETKGYDRVSHISIFAALTRLHDEKGWSKDQIAALCARCEL